MIVLEHEVISADTVSLDKMCINSVELVKFARNFAMTQVNVIQTITYYCIGKWIVEEQQKGQNYCPKIREGLSDFG